MATSKGGIEVVTNAEVDKTPVESIMAPWPAKALKAAGINSMEHAVLQTDEFLLSLDGFGKAALGVLRGWEDGLAEPSENSDLVAGEAIDDPEDDPNEPMLNGAEVRARLESAFQGRVPNSDDPYWPTTEQMIESNNEREDRALAEKLLCIIVDKKQKVYDDDPRVVWKAVREFRKQQYGSKTR